MSASNLPMAWAQLFLRAAWCAGVRDVVISPGSRSTPLALAAHGSAELRSHFVIDERAAAFFALGQARVTGRPTMLACTSGTAGAHYFPAVIEASMSGLPLVVVTADRPWELQHTHAAQTIDQTRLFGDFARLFLALGAPEPSAGALRALARTAAQAVARALGPEPGPVHVNAPFRKPLEPVVSPERESWTATWEALMESGPTRSIPGRSALDEGAIESIAARCRRAERGLIVCGPAAAHGDVDGWRVALSALARVTGFPVLAEATSQARFGLAVGALSAFDALLRSPSFRERFAPDLILEFGAPTTSAGYAQLVAEHSRCARVVVSPLAWSDPTSSATAVLHSDPATFCHDLAARLDADPNASDRRGSSVSVTTWARSLAVEDARACAVIDAQLPTARDAALTEAATARAVVHACPPGSILVLGNSSPVRDVDTYCPASAVPLRVLHQRGASGIDGLVAGAVGARSAAEGAAVSLLLGDVSLVHDLTSLALARGPFSKASDNSSLPTSAGGSSRPESQARMSASLVITVVNNDGGRIFEHLPIGRALRAPAASLASIASKTSAGSVAISIPSTASAPSTTSALSNEATFERCFATPPHINFAAAAAAFGIAHTRASTTTELATALAAAHAHHGATLIEAVVPPHDGAADTQAIWTRIDDHLRSRKDETS